jgi:glycosyltransferase involved in cell wall biosynthesis
MTRLAVDAFNLAADRRGMGRLVRQTLRTLDELGEVEVLLVVRTPADAAALWREFGHRTIVPSDLARERIDAVWYPWNGMRFEPRAYSIVTIHDPFAFLYPPRNAIARWREQSPIRRAIKKTDIIFAVSKWTAGELFRLFDLDNSRVRVVPNAVDPFWRPVPTPQQDPYMLILAGPEERKNTAMLFRAYDATFQDAGPHLVVAGTLGPSDERLFETLRTRRRRVRPSDEELRELYSGAMAVLVPSTAEGYGLPAVEAMACGAAVIASNAAALPETCDGAAFLVRPDENAWRSALRVVSLDAQLRQSLRERGLARVARIDPYGPAKALLDAARPLA